MGNLLTAELLVHTAGMTEYDSPAKVAAHAGLAPVPATREWSPGRHAPKERTTGKPFSPGDASTSSGRSSGSAEPSPDRHQRSARQPEPDRSLPTQPRRAGRFTLPSKITPE
ncbi:hypothetical protein [Verrucosispora sp. WMMC514]|nr:hypothetical protein [Verrucosispora sp. WMMC514]WBB94087.1 hypothetical protein O7597_14480 [Verrucosispora sp. WMMC514]